ncbi:MAG: hypothetical protein KC766_25900 [Myxococcales bacterium]|nr:hypothetical protein [Myxococcales bacterium]
MADQQHLERTRERTKRDLERFARRSSSSQIWQRLSVIGSVGWPIVLLSTGGALLGRHLDLRWGSGIRATLTLLSLGTLVGSAMAFRSIWKEAP